MNKLGPAGTGDMKLKVPKGNIHYMLCFRLVRNVSEGKTCREEGDLKEKDITEASSSVGRVRYNEIKRSKTGEEETNLSSILAEEASKVIIIVIKDL